MATVGPRGRPHIVPVTFALVGERIFTAVDDVKPKSTDRLRRLANLASNPSVSFLVDHYEQDWSGLWWVRADGTGEVLRLLPEPALEALCRRYPQYAARPPSGPVIAVEVERWVSWTASSTCGAELRGE
jgi:PPOX class probable F420-dependent enzyme